MLHEFGCLFPRACGILFTLCHLAPTVMEGAPRELWQALCHCIHQAQESCVAAHCDSVRLPWLLFRHVNDFIKHRQRNSSVPAAHAGFDACRNWWFRRPNGPLAATAFLAHCLAEFKPVFVLSPFQTIGQSKCGPQLWSAAHEERMCVWCNARLSWRGRGTEHLENSRGTLGRRNLVF